MRLAFRAFFAFSIASSAVPLATAAAGSAPVDFNRDVRPILSDQCYKCHGFDPATRKGDRRLDTREGALAENDGFRAIVPGDLEESDVHVRIHSTDKDEEMPPPKSGKSLTEAQREIIDRWISDGAKYDLHWSFSRPEKAPLPEVSNPEWCRNSIDRFILATLDHEKLTPSPEADPYTLIRRVSLDLIGLPPTAEEAEAFAKDPAPDAYDKLVDRLLASPRYGERWARRWLDIARYSDTNGYEKDRERSIWAYRDWVINAFNSGMPFDQFTIEQIAGDLLPNATQAQRIATGFHRNSMQNEEGGIDPLEYRYLSMVDRVATTGAAWLGMTIQCAQCHTHKYDPITHADYYRFMACMDNADEPRLYLRPPDADAQEQARLDQLAKAIAALPVVYPVQIDPHWYPILPSVVTTESGQATEMMEDKSVFFPGPGEEKETYTVTLDASEFGAKPIGSLHLEALADERLPHKGPGRSESGNFVLSHITVTAAPKDGSAPAQEVKIDRSEADVSQGGFSIADAVSGKPGSGWGIAQDKGDWHVTHAARFHFQAPVSFPSGTVLTVRLEQQYGGRHMIGRLRLSTGDPDLEPSVIAQMRHDRLEQDFAAWISRERERNIHWTTLRPAAMKSSTPLLTLQDDDSIFVSGDITKSDNYTLTFRTELRGITALRLQAIPDERLPNHGPGRVFYEGSFGDFYLSDFALSSGGPDARLPFSNASQSFASPSLTASNAIDTDMQSGWSIAGGQGREQEAVFNLAAPLDPVDGEFTVKMLFERYYASDIGRFRISVTTDPKRAEARPLSEEIVALLAMSDGELSPEQREKLRTEFLITTPELASARGEVDRLRKPIEWPTTLVMQERPAESPRKTFIHHRGEYLQPEGEVTPAVPPALGQLPEGAPKNRMGLAQWLVSRENPLTARVVMNREWAAFFGRGIVRTIGDFGLQGDAPTHPELLDWLAVEFMDQHWSLKTMQREIVLSATYRQSSIVTPELHAIDSENRFLARGPRFRLEAELIRDAALKESGLLSEKMGGPGVRPPQPAGVTEVAHEAPKWNASVGEDRFRRSVYTFGKRSAPFALYNAFDAPTGESCVVRRDLSNSPLQALELLNDVVFVEASQALGRSLAATPGTVEERVRGAIKRCLSRPARDEETVLLTQFFEAQKARFASGELKAAEVAGEGTGDAVDRAAWTVLGRVLLNLDEAITKS